MIGPARPPQSHESEAPRVDARDDQVDMRVGGREGRSEEGGGREGRSSSEEGRREEGGKEFEGARVRREGRNSKELE